MIAFTRVTKRFPPRDILKDITVTIHPNERIGVVGGNGAGKSTFFGLITGDIAPDEGTITRPKDVRIGVVRQHIPQHDTARALRDFVCEGAQDIHQLHKRITQIREQLATAPHENTDALLEELATCETRFEQRDGYMLTIHAEKALSGLGFKENDFSAPLSSFSGGWQMRAELARTLVAHPHILLLDEPSNYLDLPAVEWLKDMLATYNGTFLLISHDRYLLSSLTTSIFDITAATLTRYNTDFTTYRAQRAARIETLQAQQKNIDQKREQLERFVERFRAKNTKASQAQSKMKQLEKLEDVAPLAETHTAPLRIPPPPRCGPNVAELKTISFAYPGAPPLFKDLSFQLRNGDKCAIVGYNGRGKTTLLRLIAGALDPQKGERRYGHNVVVGYQSQDLAETLPPDSTPLAIIKRAAPDASHGHILSLLGSFGFSHDMTSMPSQNLSGGEKIRLAFARIFANPPNLLILDEPTTHLDIIGRETLQDALQKYTGTLCFVSHDVTFTRAVAHSILALHDDGHTLYAGGYDYYREKITGVMTPTSSDSNQTVTQTDAPLSRKEQRKIAAQQRQQHAQKTTALKKRIAELEKIIESHEQERDTLLATLQNDPQCDYEKINRTLTRVHETIEKATQEWEQKALQLENILQ